MISAPNHHPEIVDAIDLLVSPHSLAILRTPKQVMSTPDAPRIALVELADDIFALGGNDLEQAAKRRRAPWLLIDTMDIRTVTPSDSHGCIRLLIGRTTLSAFTATRREMDSWCPPTVALVDFGGKWRLGGDLIADYLEAEGGRSLRASNVDGDGYSTIGENGFN